jgi:hypothetical protein
MPNTTTKQNYGCATGRTSRSKAVGVNAAQKNTPALRTTRRARADLDVTDDLTGLVLNELDANLGERARELQNVTEERQMWWRVDAESGAFVMVMMIVVVALVMTTVTEADVLVQL